jgi:hypothetical protein
VKHLQRDQSESCFIRARQVWNATGLEVCRGEENSLSASGEWWDAKIKATPRGYSTADAPFWVRPFLSRFEGRRRLPHANWFVLAGALDEDERTAFVIGVGAGPWQPETKGELKCFANDVRSAYWNNSGSVTLTVTRIK